MKEDTIYNNTQPNRQPTKQRPLRPGIANSRHGTQLEWMVPSGSICTKRYCILLRENKKQKERNEKKKNKEREQNHPP